MSFRDLLKQTGNLYEEVVTGRTTAGQEVVALTFVSSHRVLLRPLRPGQVGFTVKSGIEEAHSHTLYVEPIVGLDVSKRWRFVVGGATYIVVDIYDPAARGHHLEIKVRRI